MEFGAFPYIFAGLDILNKALKEELAAAKADKERLIEQAVAFITVENVQEYIKNQDDNKDQNSALGAMGLKPKIVH